MRYKRYILEHKIWIFLFLGLFCSIEIFLLTFSNSGWLMIYTAIVLLLSLLIGTYADYHKWKKYFSMVDDIFKDLDKKYLLCEIIEMGDRQEEQRLKELLYEMEVSMNEMVSKYRRSTQEYKEYIETWVHEIKMPISVMKMILINHDEISFGLDKEVERVEKYVEQALFYARSNYVEKDYLIKKVMLQKVVQNVILERRKILFEMKAHINIHDLELYVYSDSKWLEFILGQIVDNSIKYQDKNEFFFEIYAEELDNVTLLHIKDNGIGIKPSEISRVFEKGFTGNNGRKGLKSTGIGLYLCKKLCERLLHNIYIESEEGKWTVVTLAFPHSDMIDMD